MDAVKRHIVTALKRFRNAVAQAISNGIRIAPFLERPVIFLGRRLGKGPVQDSLYREARTRLARMLANDGRDIRPIQLGSVDIRFSIAHFTMHGFWFQGIIYEESTLEILKQKLRAGSTFVDIGANAGYFSIIAGTLVGSSGRVIACEPNPDVFQMLQRHVAANHLDGIVSPFQIALGDSDQEAIDLFIPVNEFNNGLASILNSHSSDNPDQKIPIKSVKVSCARFDSLASRIELMNVDLMKIDVEGAEGLVISGMKGFLSLFPPKAIILETRLGSQAYDLLIKLGYLAHLMDRLDSANGNYLFERGH